MPLYSTQLKFSFANRVAYPAQVAVFDIDGTTGLSRSLYLDIDYTVDWMTKDVILNSPLVLGNRLRVDVYEVGNGDQLAKSNTQTVPLRYGPVTGLCEIYLNCNYTGTLFSGSGVIVSGTAPVDVVVSSTDATDDTMLCDAVDQFLLNAPITFTGTSVGGVAADGTVYYVKTISLSAKRISISLTKAAGIAGPVFELSTDAGSMTITVRVGTADVYSPPILSANGMKLTKGNLLNISAITGLTNSVTCNTTSEILANEPIVFSNTIFGGVIQPLTTYYIKDIIDANEFTISETPGGLTLVLGDNSSGGAIAVTNDYAFGVIDGSTAAKIIFSMMYDHATSFISYSIFGETEPVQYGYTLPEVEIITGSTDTAYTLMNYIGGDNSLNAIVEKNGVRMSYTADYTIDITTSILTLGVAPLVTDVIAVTSYNMTDRQYLHTQYDITDAVNNSVSQIVYVDNKITTPLAVTSVLSTAIGTNLVTCDSTLNFVEDQTVIFQDATGTGTIGGIAVDGTVYYVKTITSPADGTFTISDTRGGAVWPLANSTTAMVATVGGTPAVRVETGTPHGFIDNDLVRLDGIIGSTQLNNVIFYTKRINDNEFDLYSLPYSPVYTYVNSPVIDVFTYVSGGYAWQDRTYTLITTVATATTSTGNWVTVSDPLELINDTAIIFTEVGAVAGDVTLGGLIIGTTYYIVEVSPALNRFTLSESYKGPVKVLTTTGPVTVDVTQWEQTNVDRLWVTVNGYRVPSSSLRINPDNNLSILTTILAGDKVTITNMIPTASPNELVYRQSTTKNDISTVYRANRQTRTWLTAPLYDTDDVVHIFDATTITGAVIQNVVAPAPIDGEIMIYLTADKRIITQLLVYNLTTEAYLVPTVYEVIMQNITPMLHIMSGAIEGQSLIITTIEGNLIYLNGEQIRFSHVDIITHTLSGLQRGANGTGRQVMLPEFTEVYGILSQNKLPDALYDSTFSESDYPDDDGDVDGGPLQFFDTPAALFLQHDIK